MDSAVQEVAATLQARGFGLIEVREVLEKRQRSRIAQQCESHCNAHCFRHSGHTGRSAFEEVVCLGGQSL